MKRKLTGGYWRNGKWIAITWGDKISAGQKTPEYFAKRGGKFICEGCGEERFGKTKNQKACGYKCQYARSKKDPIKHKAFTIANTLLLGKGKKEFFLALLKSKLNKPCKYCKTLLSLENVSVDHIEPYTTTAARQNKAIRKQFDRKDNLQIICKSCNQMKGILSDKNFIVLLEFLDKNISIGQYVRRKLAQSTIMWSYKRGTVTK